MIISASRRTDIPSFYSEWFMKRIESGELMVRNPMNYHQVSRIVLSPELIDCIVFWTKDPANIIPYLDKIEKYNYYFQITVNSYGNKIERNVRDKDSVVNSFIQLSKRIGKERTVWRYDPIIISGSINFDFHLKNFEYLANKLYRYTERCVISFVDTYKKSERNLNILEGHEMSDEEMISIGDAIARIALKYGIKVETCSEKVDLSKVGIEHTSCIDKLLIERIIGKQLDVKKDKNQRNECGCISSIDVGVYNTCQHDCLYCYANMSTTAVNNNIAKHDQNSPLLIGDLLKDDKITDKKIKTHIKTPDLFDLIKMNTGNL